MEISTQNISPQLNFKDFEVNPEILADNIIENIETSATDIGKDILGDEFIDFVSEKKELTEKEFFMNKVNKFFNAEKNYRKNQYYIYDSKTKSNFLHLIAFELYNVKINFIFIVCLIIGITCGFSIWYFKRDFGSSIFIGFIVSLILVLFQAIFIYKWEIRNIFQYYLQKFLYNLNYITTCSSKWDEIMNLFNKIKKKEPTFNPPSLKQKKPIYDKQIFIYILYIIVCILIIFFGYFIYYLPSSAFNYVINMFSNTSFYLKLRTYSFLIVFIFLILLYYVGISLLINLFISMTKFLILMIVYILLGIEYIILAVVFIIKHLFKLIASIGKLLFNSSSSDSNTDVGQGTNNAATGLTGNIANPQAVNLDDIPSSSFFGDVSKASILYMNKCKNMSKIEKLFSKYNKPRDTTQSRSFVNKLVRSEQMPGFIKNNSLLKCLTKEEDIKKKNQLKCPANIID